jgi:succinate dehydrogenase/fumarate reductase flavoprotein subunit
MEVDDVSHGVHEIGMWRRVSGAQDFRGLARVFADRSLETWNWLDGLGVPFTEAVPSPKNNVYRGSRYYHRTKATPVNRDGKDTDMQAGGAGLIWPMYDQAVKNGAKFLLNHKMTRIIREGDKSGRVLGVEVDAGGKTLYVKADKAVFLGTGSWKGNPKLKLLFSPMLEKYPHISGEPYVWNDGKGVQAGLDVGASLTTDRGSDWHGWHRHPGTLWHSIDLPYGLPGTEDPDPATCIFVNALGNRFMNEEIGEESPAWIGGHPPFYFQQIAALQPTNEDGPIVWIVMDEDARIGQEMEFTVGKIVEENMYATAPTIAELAAKIKVPVEALTEAVTKYNSYVAAGKDPDFDKQEMAAKIEKPPFHAILWGIQKHNTLGGLTINDKAQVLDWNLDVIPGLYAAGEAAGGMDLIGLARPILFGRVAGEWAAKEPSLV